MEGPRKCLGERCVFGEGRGGRERLQGSAGVGVGCVQGKGARRDFGGPPRAWGREVRMAAEPQLKG